jgi:hypothetical protein
MSAARTVSGVTLIFIVMAFSATGAIAQGDTPSGKISIETTSIAAGIGLSWGNGTLNFKGQDYRFSIDGVTLIDFGMSKASATGEVYNLGDLAKFEGNYMAVEASFALGGGMGSMSLRNPYGVILQLKSISQGARLQLGSSGMKIELW